MAEGKYNRLCRCRCWNSQEEKCWSMLDKLTREDFAKHLNQHFRLRSDSGELKLELIEATAIGTSGKPPDGTRAPFSVVFRGPKEAPLAQMIYHVEHQAMGKFGLFMVPIGPDDQGMLYEVVFN